jgi:hypothetical protein
MKGLSMNRALISFVFAIFAVWGSGVIAQDAMPPTRTIYERGIDLVGKDLAQIFDTSLPACEAACTNTSGCEAFTFNQRSNACFPKADVTGISLFEGALSGRIYPIDPVVFAGARERAAELLFLSAQDFSSAARLTRLSNQPLRNVTAAQRAAWIRAVETDLSADWLSFGRLAEVRDSGVRYMALSAHVKAYLRSLDLGARRAAASEIAFALEDQGHGRRMIDALRLAQVLQFDRETEVQLFEAIGKYGFRVVDTKVESDSTTPRICAVFNEDLIKAGTDYTPFVQLPDTQLVVTVSDGQLCVDGVVHGERYRLVLREGLPAASGETLIQPVELTLYVRDRAPSVRFVSRAYVLPRLGDIAIPIETVNMTEVDLKLSRIDDRNLMRTIQSGLMDPAASRYNTGFVSSDIGTSVWSGTADVTQDLNRDMLTRLPMGDVLRDEPAGLYALTVASTDESRDVTPSTQWFVLSDIGVATYLGNDGLTVAVRGLGDAKAIADARDVVVAQQRCFGRNPDRFRRCRTL